MSALVDIAQWGTLLILSIVTVLNARAHRKVAKAQRLLAADAANDRIETIRLACAVGDEVRRINGRAEVSPAEGSTR